jgi:murein DD-endopeptidase MepM/ murein hydrolase activator NlpD
MPKVPKEFILAVVNEDGDTFSAFPMTRRRLAGFAAAALSALAVLAFLIALGFRAAAPAGPRAAASRDGEAVQRQFKAWEARVNDLEARLKTLQRRNHQLRTTAFLSLPDVEYGIGGAESPLDEGLFAFDEAAAIETDLGALEKLVQRLDTSTAELENTISKKQREIAHYPSIQPVRGGWLSSSFGKRVDPFTGKIEDHEGIDISVRPGTEVYASGAGTVKEAVTRYVPNKGYGVYIVLDHGFGYETLYGHLSKIFVKKGQQVRRWDLIGLTGDTGKSTAPHLHYEVVVNRSPRNPVYFLLE